MGGTRRNDIPTGRIVLDYWEKWTGHEAAAMQTVVDAFNASQDRWWVTISASVVSIAKPRLRLPQKTHPICWGSGTATFLFPALRVAVAGVFGAEPRRLRLGVASHSFW